MKINEQVNTLYHYTSPETLISILKNKELWITQYSFLNDKEELINSLELLSKIAIKSELNVQKAIDFLKSYSFYVAVFSLSSEKDLLSQWRSYCPPTGGYAIGFDTEKLNSIMQERGFNLLQKCVYGEKDKMELINRFIKDNPPRNYNDAYAMLNINIDEFIKRIGLIAKNEGFREECEWRSISKITNTIFQYPEMKWDVRAGAHSLIPYLKVKLGEELPINSIVIGPCRDIELAKNSVKKALDILYPKNNIEIIKSIIPYRH